MTRWLGLRARLRDIVRRRAAEVRIDEEMRFHLDMEAERLEREGLSSDEARRRALASFGSAAGHRDAVRDGHRLLLLEDGWRDVRLAVRGLRRDPGHAVVAAGTLAIAIGMASTMIAVAQAVYRDTRTVRDAGSLAVVWSAPPSRPADHVPWSLADLRAYTRASTVVDGVAGVIFQGATAVVFSDGTETWPVGATWVTGDFFRVLGVTPSLGRLLDPGDDAVGAAPVMVISHSAWQTRFGGRRDIIGRQFDLGGRRHRVVGVLPSGFGFPRNADAWLPVLPSFPATQQQGRGGGADVMLFDLVARRKTGIETAQLHDDIARFLRRTDPQRAVASRDAAPVVVSFSERISGDIKPTVRAAEAAVALLLLIACVNVANLLLIRGGSRGQELSIRHALGAGRARLIRQLLTEAGVLAALGGLGGVAFAWLGARALRALAPAAIPHRELIGIDVRVLIGAVALTVGATLLSGLLPAVISARGDLGGSLRGGRNLSGNRDAAHRLRGVLVAGQIALSMMVLTAAGLITRSLLALQAVDLGFAAEGLTVVETLLPPQAAPAREQQAAIQASLLARLRALPGVRAAAALTKPPFAAEGGWVAPVSGEGQSSTDAARNPFVDLEVVTDQFFETLQLPVAAGRAFDTRDREDAPAVAIISESLAKRLWPERSPIGRRIKLGPPNGAGPWMQIIGVVRDTRFRELATPRAALYLAASQFRGPVPMTLAFRAPTGRGPSAEVLRTVFVAVHPELRIATSATFDSRLSAPMARPRFGAALFMALGAATLLLCVVGIAGTMAATVRERRHEFGIRLALGETPSSLEARVLRYGASLTATGLLVGAAGVTVTSGALGSLLFDVSPSDPTTLLITLLIVAIVALGACWWPARRAAHVDPLAVLREAAT